MSFLYHPFSTNTSPSSSLTPLFRLLDDFESYRTDPTASSSDVRELKSFTPKFDVKETTDAYELHGELPGIEQKDVEIEFTDASTLTVRGRTERSYTSGTPPFGLLDASKTAGAIEGSKNGSKSHKATVEDAKDTDENTELVQAKPRTASEGKYWISERSIGEFSRSFNFPARIDQERVKAAMKNGLLSVHVPKSKKMESRKISIE